MLASGPIEREITVNLVALRTIGGANGGLVSKSDPEAKIAKMKDGTTHLAYKPEHAVDLDTARRWPPSYTRPDEGDTTTLEKTLRRPRRISRRWTRHRRPKTRPNV